MSTGLTKPVATLASADPESDIWAVFEDEVSDGGFEYDDAQNEIEADHRRSPQFDRHAAANAVREFEQDRNHTLAPPRPAFADTPKQRARGWSSGSKSGRTSSSSSGNRTALTGLLETVGMMGNSTSGLIPKSKSGRASRTSNRSDETRFTQTSLPQQAEDYSKWSVPAIDPITGSDAVYRTPLLLANERIVFTSSISVRPPSSMPLPSFLLPAPKRLQLILTDFPRLSSVGLKDEDLAQLKVKSECVFVTRPSAGTIGSGRSAQIGGTVANRVVDVQEKGAKGFVVQTVGVSGAVKRFRLMSGGIRRRRATRIWQTRWS